MPHTNHESHPATGHQDRCVVCHAPLTWIEARMSPVCRNISCITAHNLQRVPAWREQNKAFRQQLERQQLVQASTVRNASAATGQIADPETYVARVVPANQRRLSRLPKKRRTQFIKHLEGLLKEVAQATETEAEQEQTGCQAHPGSLPILGAACATCQGFCCLQGGTHAYLNVRTLKRSMRDSEPDGLEALGAEYARYLPDRTYQDSCVFHTKAGCALPTELRSDVCLNYGCQEFFALRDRYNQDRPKRFFLAAMEEQQVVRFQFVDSEPLSCPEPDQQPNLQFTNSTARATGRKPVRRRAKKSASPDEPKSTDS